MRFSSSLVLVLATFFLNSCASTMLNLAQDSKNKRDPKKIENIKKLKICTVSKADTIAMFGEPHTEGSTSGFESLTYSWQDYSEKKFESENYFV